MNDLVQLVDGTPIVTSKTIADSFGMPHRSVLRAIDTAHCSEEFREHNFVLSYYVSPQNKKIKCINITRDGFAFVAMGLTGSKAGAWKESYIKAFNKMEEYLKKDLGTDSLIGAINEASRHINLIAEQGSRWGKAGSEIRKNKRKAIENLGELIDQAQMRLNFEHPQS